MHIGGFADVILQIETRDRGIYFHTLVGSTVVNKLSKKWQPKMFVKHGNRDFSYPALMSSHQFVHCLWIVQGGIDGSRLGAKISTVSLMVVQQIIKEYKN